MIEQTALFEEELPAILDYIPSGKDNAVSMRYLAVILSTDTRKIRSMVHNARISGHVVIGDENGYYKPECEEDLIGWIRKETAALRSKNMALQSARIALSEGRYPSEGENYE